MPIYEYICSACGERFSQLQSIRARQEDTRCSKCGSSDVRKVMSSFCCSTSGDGVFSSAPSSHGSGGG